MATFRTEIVDRVANRRNGIPSKCKFLPTIADLVEIAETFERQIPESCGFVDRGVVVSMEDYHAMQFYPNSPEAAEARERLRIRRQQGGNNG